MCPVGHRNEEKNYFLLDFLKVFGKHLFSENFNKNYCKKLWCQIVRFIRVVPNCPGTKLSVFTILVPNCPVPNCPGAKLSGAKLSCHPVIGTYVVFDN